MKISRFFHPKGAAREKPVAQPEINAPKEEQTDLDRALKALEKFEYLHRIACLNQREAFWETSNQSRAELVALIIKLAKSNADSMAQKKEQILGEGE